MSRRNSEWVVLGNEVGEDDKILLGAFGTLIMGLSK